MRRSKVYKCACSMPRGLRHTVGETFDIKSSEVVSWLIKQPVLLQYLFNKVHDSGAIVFNPESRTWSGADNLPHFSRNFLRALRENCEKNCEKTKK